MKEVIIFDHMNQKIYSSTKSYNTIHAACVLEEKLCDFDLMLYKVHVGEQAANEIQLNAHCTARFVDIVKP